MNNIFSSFVITTYNRIDVVSIAIQSVLEQIQLSDKRHEIIIVDDASQDGTQNFLITHYQKQIDDKLIKLRYLDKNIGVTG